MGELSKKICIVCWQIIEQFNKFSIKIQMAQQSLSLQHDEIVYTSTIENENNRQSNHHDDGNEYDTNINDENSDCNEMIENDVENASNSSDIEMNNSKQLASTEQLEIILPPQTMPKNFDEQNQSDDIYKRFRQM